MPQHELTHVLSVNTSGVSLHEAHFRVHRWQGSAKLKTSKMSIYTSRFPLGSNSSWTAATPSDHLAMQFGGHDSEHCFSGQDYTKTIY